MQSEHIRISNIETDIGRAYQLLDDYIFDIKLEGKNALRLRLLTEEVLRLAKSIVDETTVEIWFEGGSKLTNIYLTADNNIDSNKQKELISISTTGENSAQSGFFSQLVKAFLFEAPAERTWTLKDYRNEILRKRREDKYSQEAWDDLERSLVANLADDIIVSIDKNKIKMWVIKDFSEALSTVGSSVPQIVTNPLIVDSDYIQGSNANSRADEAIEELELSKKDALHLKLVFEETIGMLKEMTGDYSAVVWFEKYKNEACLKLTAKTLMSAEKKSTLLDMSSGGNASVKGFMGKVRDVIENGILGYNNVMKLQQEYGGGYISYGTMGMYGSTEGLADSGITWSLYEYRNALSDDVTMNESAKQAWDELEKSIVASVAKDVIVGVKGDRVDMTVVCTLNK
ncbi:MAG: hypothetical protein J6O61_13470 [Butyrivibrio sp.]|uniref:hypothetical protein n=1 Tax=Butyrivibrio sp. TaxID=28121 RepID=UPI001B2DDEF3|nr:hypothetical protein [Butyrivibrio sp.]MBO6241830.1 hypothetical protein [Butyrivibrio sp.]